MSLAQADLDAMQSMLLTALQANSRAESSDMEKRLTNLEYFQKAHMEWEERNGDAIKDTLQKQQTLIEKLFDKFDESNKNTDTCKMNLENKISKEYVSVADFDLYKVNANANLMTASSACNSISSKIEGKLKSDIEHAEAHTIQYVDEGLKELTTSVANNTKLITEFKTRLTTVAWVGAGAITAFNYGLQWFQKLGVI